MRIRHRYISNKGKLTREFDTGEILAVSKYMKSIIKDGVDPKLVFKTRGTYRVLYKATPNSYWIQRFPSGESLCWTRKKVKE